MPPRWNIPPVTRILLGALVLQSVLSAAVRYRQWSAHSEIVVEWLKKIFDPKTYPCFRDEFIHPDALVPMMAAAREGFGLKGYVAATPA